MEVILKGLNAAQRAAVTSRATVLQCLAPPGSGKTKTLTSRVAFLINEGYRPQNLICCTFTIKAAREMRERLRGLVGNDLERSLILGTFHSICRRYLVAYGHLIGIPSSFGIADSDDSLGIIKKLQKSMKFGMDVKTARSKISSQKAKGLHLEDILRKSRKSLEAQEFAEIFQSYQTALEHSNLLDYDDLLLKTVELLRMHPECVSNIEAVLIDEFQDTNIVQFELMKLLAAARRRITIVGDPDQSIYSFRAAEIENLKRMQEFYPETVVINLEENYRSSSAILHLAQDVMEQDDDRPSKRLKSTHCYGTLPVLRRLPNPREEAAWIVSEVKRVTKMTGGCVSFSDIAILLRSGFLSLLIEKQLANSGVPYKMVGGMRFFDRVEVRIVLDYLRVISHPDNNSALQSIINIPTRKIGEGTMSVLNKAADGLKQSLWATIPLVLKGEVKLEKKLSSAAEKGLRDFVNLIRKGQDQLGSYEPTQAPGKLIELVATTLKLQDYLKKEFDENWEERWENIKELSIQARDVALEALTAEDHLPEIEGIKQAEGNAGHEVLARFLANVALSTEVEASEEAQNVPRVTISTIHSAKGLEWPIVFVPALYEGSIPHSRSDNTSEERRLLYVAITRAKALLYMTFPVLQSRDNSESILTQFLPSNIHHRTKDIGPSFYDQVVQDIAIILGRSAPLQEVLGQALTSLEANESANDDIWPADGSHRLQNNDFGTGWRSFDSKDGQSMLDAMQGGSYEQRRSYSDTTVAFTSAAQYKASYPNEAEPLSKSKAPKLVKSVSGQNSIHSFFIGGSTKTQKDTAVVGRAQGSLSLNQAATGTSLPSIPKELSTHRIGKTFIANPASSRPKSRPPLTDISSGEGRLNKRPYSCFSSSPTQDLSAETASTAINSIVTVQPPKYNTTMSSLKNGRQNYHEGMLNTSARSAQPMCLPSNNTNTTIRRAYGARPMTSWANRKHK